MFDFATAIQEAKASSHKGVLEALILGPSGAGKSSLLGTFGVKTLYLYTAGESHGPDAAAAAGGDIVAVCIDYANGEMLSPDAALQRLSEILGSGEKLVEMGIKAIAVDGASELETLIRKSKKWEALCTNKKGEHNNYAETAATCTLFRAVIQPLADLRRKHGIHYAMSCILDVKTMDDTGAISEATPRLQGYAVAETVVQLFGDVLVVGRMSKDDVVKHKIQFMVDLPKVSKDLKGNIKKAINFSPRLTNVPVQNLPAYLDANLAKAAEVKANGGKV